MSKSLAITNGDLSIEIGRAFTTVTGSAKLAQDLRLWTLEHLGQDPSYPQMGNILDGGMSDDHYVDGFIGQIANDERISEIRSIVNVLLGQYQQLQVDKIRREIVDYQGKHTLDDDEILHSIDRVEAKQFGTTIVVRATITTLKGSTVAVTIPVEV